MSTRKYPDDFINKIICGDCLELMKEMPDDCVDLVLTDPPYGVNASYSNTNVDEKDDYWKWLMSVIEECRRISTIVILTHRIKALKYLLNWDWIGVWNKPYSSGCRIGNSPIVPHWEPIFFYGIHELGVHGQGVNDVWSYNPCGHGELKGEHGRVALRTATKSHPFPKPINLISHLITNFTKPNEIIFDPFLGSGTTAEACKLLKRNFIGIEINPDYCKIAEERLAQGVL